MLLLEVLLLLTTSELLLELDWLDDWLITVLSELLLCVIDCWTEDAAIAPLAARMPAANNAAAT
jgi:hypothetical protein